LYSNSDIIFADAESKQNQSIIDYFTLIFDPEYYCFVHTSCCQAIDQMTADIPTIHMTNFEWDDLYQFNNMLNFYGMWTNNRGNEVHYNQNGNRIILQTLTERIDKIIA
jgi:hypothetical protein